MNRQSVADAIRQDIGIRGCGTLECLVWGRKYAGVDQSSRGIAVTIQQYGMKAYSFFIRGDKVRFRGRWLKV